METDDFFYRLLKQLPGTVFELIGLPASRSRAYRFDSVEVKKSLRIDGLYLPKRPNLPLLFVEIQFQLLQTFYANLFTKVFAYLEENNPAQDWLAVPIFVSRAVEPTGLVPYEPLLQSGKVKRIYLKEHPMPNDVAGGMAILQLVTAPLDQTKQLVARIVEQSRVDDPSAPAGTKVIELVEELLVRRLPELNREEVRNMYELTDLRKTRAWQEIHDQGVEEGVQKGLEKGIEEGEIRQKSKMVQRCLDKGMSIKEVAEFLEITVQEVRRLSKK